MKKYIINLIKQAVIDIPYKTATEVTHNQFAYIGIDRLEKVIDEIKKDGEKYVSLAEIYSRVIRDNLARQNSEIVHDFFELKPKLNKYYKHFPERAEDTK